MLKQIKFNMNTKIVYVVVSDENDYYLEQTLVSAYSARLYNPNAEILLLIDSETDRTIVGKRKAILKYISQKIIVNPPMHYTRMQKSRFLKTTLRRYIEGDYLFIDSDTIITGDLSDIDNIHFDLAAVPDQHVIIRNNWLRASIKKWATLLDWKFSETLPYFNSGVFYVKDTQLSHEFYENWFYTWERSSSKGLYIDQPSLAKADELHNHIIGELSGIWNCQIKENGLPFLMEAKIIHYFASGMKGKKSNPYSFYDSKIYDMIKSDGDINQKLHSMILHAKSTFRLPCIILGETDIPYLYSNTYQIYLKTNGIFRIIEMLSCILIAMGKIIKKVIKL